MLLCITCSSIFLLYIHSIYILFFCPFDRQRIRSLLWFITFVTIIPLDHYYYRYYYYYCHVSNEISFYLFSISTLYTYFSSLRSIPIQSTENSTAFVVYHFCHNYSTRSLLLSLLLLLLLRFERNILFHATLYYMFIYIPSLYPLYIHTFLLSVRSQFNRQRIRPLLWFITFVTIIPLDHYYYYCHVLNEISFSMLLCTTCSRSISTLCTYFSSLHSIPIQSTGNSTAFMVHHFCHNYSTRSLLLSLLLLLLPRFERNILFHATLYYVFTIYIHSIYILFFSSFDPNSIDREFVDF